jgi:RimJ/RimL family protein N-acetyltransferase
MFGLDGVTLRALSLEDRDRMYAWYLDGTSDRFGGWSRWQSREAFDARWETNILTVDSDCLLFGIEHQGELVGRIELALIDRENRNAAIGFFLGELSSWGKGIATRAVRMVTDYAFMVQNLERVYAHVYGFNERSQRLMQRVGFTAEGILRRQELHNGQLQDMHVFGMLKDEFYARYDSLFALPV